MPKASDVCIGDRTANWESTGTSFGAALTSGEAALLVSILGSDRAGETRALIQRTADDIGVEGDDPYYGKGRIDVAEARQGGRPVAAARRAAQWPPGRAETDRVPRIEPR